MTPERGNSEGHGLSGWWDGLYFRHSDKRPDGGHEARPTAGAASRRGLQLPTSGAARQTRAEAPHHDFLP